jgi:predicted dehydrogenase
MPNEYGNAFALSTGADLRPVENEDYLSCLLRFANGARGTLIASRVAVAEHCNYGVQIHGSKGALSWDFRRMGELQLSARGDYLNQATQLLFVGPEHGALGAFQPAAGVALGFDDLKVIEAANFIRGIAEGRDFGATIEDAVSSAAAIEAMLDSAQAHAWWTLATQTSEPATRAAAD